MLSYRGLLEGAIPLHARAPGPVEAEISALLDELKQPQRRRHPPLQYIRREDALEPVRAEAERLDAAVPQGAGIPMIRALLLDAYPRVFELTDGPRSADGLRVVRVSTAGTYLIPSAVRIAAVLHMEIAKGSGRVWHPAVVTSMSVWHRVVPDPAAGTQEAYDVSQRLVDILMNLERAAAVSIERRSDRPYNALWVGDVLTGKGGLPERWHDHLSAIGRTQGLDLRVADQPKAEVVDLLKRVSGRGVDILCTWGTTQEILRIRNAFQAAHPSYPAIDLSGTYLEETFDDLWMELDAAVDHWQPEPTTPAIPPEGVVYLQKYGTAGDHDQFTVRAGPCGHDQFTTVHSADKGTKGITRMFSAEPKSVSKCGASACQCWMAQFRDQ